jgi:hypothetical protein
MAGAIGQISFSCSKRRNTASKPNNKRNTRRFPILCAAERGGAEGRLNQRILGFLEIIMLGWALIFVVLALLVIHFVMRAIRGDSVT